MTQGLTARVRSDAAAGGSGAAMPMEETIQVELGSRSHSIHVGSGTLGTLGARLEAAGAGPRIAVLTTTTVGRLYADGVRAGLEAAGFEPEVIEIPDGEEHKTLATLAGIYDRLIAARLDRGATLVALGGGVVGDLGGFAAATFLRGIALAHVPTALVAQVDASVGGKTAVNHAAGKNLIGAFYQPRIVLADVDVLGTLPQREFVAGLAEVIKYGATLDRDLFAYLEGALDQVLTRDAATMVHVVAACCRLKAAVVGADETEQEYRAVLNFGHTVGHAIEAVTGYGRYLHGEAVAIGMICATRISAARGYCDRATAARVRQLIERAGLPTEVPPDLEAEAIARAIGVDKKIRGGAVRFVCLDGLGGTRFEWLTGAEIIGFLRG